MPERDLVARIQLPIIGTILPRAITSQTDAWHNDDWLTVRFTREYKGFRFHRNGTADTPNISGIYGRWILLGDPIFPAANIVQQTAIEMSFSHAAIAQVSVGTVMNVGVANRMQKWNRRGGAWQAEYISGPFPRMEPIASVWGLSFGQA